MSSLDVFASNGTDLAKETTRSGVGAPFLFAVAMSRFVAIQYNSTTHFLRRIYYLVSGVVVWELLSRMVPYAAGTWKVSSQASVVSLSASCQAFCICYPRNMAMSLDSMFNVLCSEGL